MSLAHQTIDPLRATARSTLVAHKLSQAIAAHQLQVVYQPEVELASLKLVSFEALCRWHDEALGQVNPDEFIAAAESSGLIAALGLEVLRQVLLDLPSLLARWPKSRVAINVSGLELAQPHFAEQFLDVLDKQGTPVAHHLELEITESIFHLDPEVVRQNLMTLQARGLSVAIDDFGTGQSSLSRLHQLPFDKIKMDKSFVQALSAPTGRAILKAMNDLSGALQRALVVEGVETQQQREALMQLGCKLGQGYLFCPPQALQKLLATCTLPAL